MVPRAVVLLRLEAISDSLTTNHTSFDDEGGRREHREIQNNVIVHFFTEIRQKRLALTACLPRFRLFKAYLALNCVTESKKFLCFNIAL